MKLKSLLSCLLVAVVCIFSSCEKTEKMKDVSITFTNVYESVSLKVGQSYVLEYSVQPEDLLSTESIIWKSSDESVATVVNGQITALAEGETTITAEIAGIKQSVDVKVNGFAVSGFDLAESCSLIVGDRVKIDAGVTPYQAGLSSVNWKIADESIATVQVSDEEIYITGVKKGKTTLTGRWEDVEKVCNIEVGNAVESIALTISD